MLMILGLLRYSKERTQIDDQVKIAGLIHLEPLRSMVS